MSELLSVDLSSHNTVTNLRAVWNAGIRVLGLKATEGTNYDWSSSNTLADEWHSWGGFVNRYHFMHPGNVGYGAQQADWFVKNIAGHYNQRLDLLTVDHETSGESDAEVGAFIDRVMAHYPHARGLQYAYESFFSSAHITRHHGWGLWVADYSAHVGSTPVGWPTWDLWQYTSTGSIPGIQGNVDISRVQRHIIQPTLHQGDNNFAVLDAKRMLRKAGFHTFVMNGVYGWGTVRAVKAFKQRHGLNNDGTTIGGACWNALNHYL